jgi:hypothetical protein
MLKREILDVLYCQVCRLKIASLRPPEPFYKFVPVWSEYWIRLNMQQFLLEPDARDNGL